MSNEQNTTAGKGTASPVQPDAVAPATSPTLGGATRVEPEALPRTQVNRLVDYALHATVTPSPLSLIDTYGWRNIDSPASSAFPLTQLGNAERLVSMFGDELRYCPTWGKWLIWEGKKWVACNEDSVYGFAAKTVRSIPREAESNEDPGTRTAIWKHAKQSERKNELDAMVGLARSLPTMNIPASQLDSHPYLFNCKNGTVDLRTGRLRPHNRADFLTKLAPVTFTEGATCPMWLRFLHDVFAGDEAL